MYTDNLYKHFSVTVKPNYDLRTTFEEKKLDSGIVGWTAFMNRRGTLIHLCHHSADFMIRLPLRVSLKDCSTKFIEKEVSRMVGDYLK